MPLSVTPRIVRAVSLENWNERYRAREEINDEPAAVLVEAATDLPPGRALDLACGAGRNALWLARRGWAVVAIDGASEAIRILKEHAGDLTIDTRVLDLENGQPLPFPDESFDLVAILFYLHRPLFAEAKRLVRPGGLVVAAARTTGINPRFCVAPGELRGFFAGWEGVVDREGEVAEVAVRRR